MLRSMVDFRPFHGLLPHLSNNEDIAERVSPPYDIISAREQEELQSNHTTSPESPAGADETMSKRPPAGRMDRHGSLFRTPTAVTISTARVFRIMVNGARNSIIGVLRAEGYEAGNIMPHEETFPQVKEDRLNLLRATATHCESIFGLYDRAELDMDRIADAAPRLFKTTDNSGTVHQLHRISDPTTVAELRDMFSTKKILIADGHHRYETACRYSRENPQDERKAYVLCTMVSSQDRGMFVRPTHRLIRDLGYQPKDLLERMEKRLYIRKVRDAGAIAEALETATSPTFGLLLRDDSMFIAEYPDPLGDILWSVDAYVCQEVILREILYALPNGNEMTIEYEHDLRSAVEQMNGGGLDLAIIVRAPSLEMVWKVAQNGRKMPKKTTYFWPKIWSGFVLYRMKR